MRVVLLLASGVLLAGPAGAQTTATERAAASDVVKEIEALQKSWWPSFSII